MGKVFVLSDISGFVDGLPTTQKVIDLFDGEWSSEMPMGSGVVSRPGQAALFSDARLLWAASVLGPFADLDILELGPLEGAHSYLLQQLGAASVTAIEANARAFLKCLCVKEIFDLSRVHFKLGSFMHYLDACGRYDVIVASGVLYHMVDPVRFLRTLTDKADRIYIWTHYYDRSIVDGRQDRDLFAPVLDLDGSSYLGSERLYPERALSWKGFSGGLESYATWMERDSLFRLFDDRGFTVTINFDDPGHVNGPAIALCAAR